MLCLPKNAGPVKIRNLLSGLTPMFHYRENRMKHLVMLTGILICVFLIIPTMAIGGDEGWIEIRCNVDAASVSFDGEYKGVISGGSLTVPVYTTGTPYYSFSVKKAGYETYSGDLAMPAPGQTKTFYATLNPVPTPVPPVNYGSIYVESSPSGAAIYFNGNYRGVAPLTINEVWPGTDTISAELSGYRTFTTSATVYAGRQTRVFCPLSPLDTSGALYVLSSPADSNVYLDGVYKGQTPITLNNLASGTHILGVDHAGYYDWKSTVSVPAGGTRTISATLNPMPASTVGWIYVSSSPGGASVTVDGNAAGQTPSSGPLKLNNIQAGTHAVALSIAGYKPYSDSATVYPNTVSEISAVLQPVTVPSGGKGELSVTSAPEGANVFLDNAFVGITPVILKDVTAGSHIVTIKIDGYQEYTSSAQVNAGATSTVSAALSAASSPTPKSAPSPTIACAALALIGFIGILKFL
jgi:hypothetical protein